MIDKSINEILEGVKNNEDWVWSFDSGISCLSKICQESNLEDVKVFIKNCPCLDDHINASDVFQEQSPLAVAVYYGKDDVAEYLIDNGAKPEKTKYHRDGILSLAAESDNVSLMEKCLKREMPIDFIDYNGMSPLATSIINGSENVLHFLESYGAKKDVSSIYGNSIMHYAAQRLDTDSILKLIDYGFKLDALNNNKVTPLMKACESDNFDAARIFIDHGCSLLKEDSFGKMAINYLKPYTSLQLKNLIETSTFKATRKLKENSSEQKPSI